MTSPIDCCRPLWDESGRIMAAVSGGADSVALLLALYETMPEGAGLRCAHLNHMLRGEEADRDEGFVRALCGKLGVELICERADVRALAKSGAVSEELAARQARYAFFERARATGELVATAHTMDDNAETVIMNLLRGTGLRGLSGIPPVRGAYRRPLLSCGRAEITEYLNGKNASYVEDSSNLGHDYRRNRIRLEVIPLLKAENPLAITAICRCAHSLREDGELLDELAGRLSQKALLGDSPKRLSLCVLREAPPALCKRVLRGSAGEFTRRVSAELTEKLYRLIMEGKTSDRLHIKGEIFAVLSYDYIEFGESRPPEKNLLEKNVKIGDNIFLDGILNVELVHNLFKHDMADCGKINGKLIVRTRREGDRIELPGGGKSLKKLYIDRKIPAQLREILPVVCDRSGIVWAGAIGADRRCAPDGDTKEALCFTYNHEHSQEYTHESVYKAGDDMTKTPHPDIKFILLSESEIQKTVTGLAKRLACEYEDKNPLMLCVLKGSVIFFSDLIRKLPFSTETAFITAKSYGGNSKPGELEVVGAMPDVTGRHVIIVEDIIDTGRTLKALSGVLSGRGAQSVSICALLDKPSRREVSVSPEYTGVAIPDEFVVGYGLDYNEKYRNLPYVGALWEHIYGGIPAEGD